MITLRHLDLNGELKAYMSQCLKEGHVLSRKALERISFENGETYAALPQDFDLSKLPRFEHGGIAPTKTINPKLVKVENEEFLLHLVAEIKNYLRDVGGIVIFEDSLSGPSDPFTRNNPDRLNIVVDNQEVYYCLTPEDGSADEKILSTIRRASGPNTRTYVGFFTHVTSAPNSLGQIELLADKISAIVFGAFDRESYLLWRK